ncbi:microtubule-associated protein 9-like [Phyllobates terribilis]|uniref:microtubule-associated protein 9-like n=1 Tax=Phyllobates terribilis TaxID=111132 RepID=UPI003CCACA13
MCGETPLDYTKSPKTTKRTSFQDELKKAVSARVSREQAVEDAEYSDYSEEFESDDSLEESLGKTTAIELKLKKGHQDFHFSDSEEDSYGKTTFLKKSKETERSFSEYSSRSKSTETITQGDEEDGGSKLGPLEKVKTQQGADDEGRKPIPKPREFRSKSSSSLQGLGISLSDEGFPPAPLQRNLSQRSGHLEDTAEGEQAKDKPASLSSPPSLMRLNDNISASKTPSFSNLIFKNFPSFLDIFVLKDIQPLDPSYSLSIHRLSGPPTPASRLKLLSTAAEKNNKARSKEESEEIIKDLQVGKEDFSENKESGGNARKSPSAFDMIISDVKEKTLQQETKDDSIVRSHEKRDDHEKIKQTHSHGQLDNQKNLKTTLELGRTHSNRSFSASQTKKSSKLSTRVSAMSRYLGTLTILDASVNKESGEVEAADKLRATVCQYWLGKKKIFLHELSWRRNRKTSAFERWNDRKGRVLKEKIGTETKT